MKAFISHSYFTDEAVTSCLEKAFETNGITCYDHKKLSKRLRLIDLGGPDEQDLINAYRQAGRPAPTQEISDPQLHRIITEEIAQQDVVVILWSEQYSQKFWTQREMKTALSIGLRIVAIMMDNFTLDEELQKGVNSGRIPLFRFGNDFSPCRICTSMLSLDTVSPPQQPKKFTDQGFNRTFLRIEHPSLGPYEIAESYFTWKDMERFGGKVIPAGHKAMDIADNVSPDFISNFCHFVSQHSPYYRYRLPTESEWEFAARAGNSSIYDWIKDSDVDRDGVPAIRNAWDMWFASNAFEWTSTLSEWHEYNGWVQPIPINENQLGSDRGHIVKQINDGPGKGGYYPHIVHKDKKENRLGFRLIRERRKDINLDQVFRIRHRNLARELLSTSDPKEFRASIYQKVEYGIIHRYFRDYLERCVLDRSFEMKEPLFGLAETLLVQILKVAYVPPLTLPPYLQDFFRQGLREVFDDERPDIAFSSLLDRLEELNLLGREFAEVLRYDFGGELAFESCWQACLTRLQEKDTQLLFRFCS